MVIKQAPDIRSSEITSKAVYLKRREFLQAAGITTAAALAGVLGHDQPVEAAPGEKLTITSTTVTTTDSHYIAPIKFNGDAAAAWKKLLVLVTAQPRTTLIEQKPNYLCAEFKTATMGYVDDVEFALDAKAKAIQVRSASRLGIRDFGVNRKRIEALRAGFTTAK